MERSASVPTGTGEQSLTPGEQRILVLLEQLQQRMAPFEKKLEEQGQQLRELADAQQGFQEVTRSRDDWLHKRWDLHHRQVIETLCERTNKLQSVTRERSDKQELTLSMLESMVRRNSEDLLLSRAALEELQREVRSFTMDARLGLCGPG
jgi:hypothetical protein